MKPGILLEDLSEAAAVPRSNGELVFNQPWESLAFGLVVGLCESEVLEWERFRSALIAEIADWTAHHRSTWSYYACWLRALEQVLTDLGLLELEPLEARTAQLLAESDHGHSDGAPDHHP